MSREPWALWVERALEPDQRQAIVDRFTERNRSWRGAAAADILDALAESDSDLAIIEPFFERHPELVAPGAGEALRALIWSGQDVTPDALLELLKRTVAIQEQA